MPRSVGKPIGVRRPLDLGLGTTPQFIGAAGPTIYNQALTGALSFAGSEPLFSMQRSLAGSLSFSGALLRSPARLLVAAISFTGAAILAAITRILAAGFTPTSTLKRSAAHILTAALSFTGSAPLRAVTRLLAGSLAPSGALKRSSTRSLFASITPTGALSASKALLRTLVGATLHPTAALSAARAYLHSLAGALTFLGGSQLAPDPALYPNPALYPYGGAIIFQLNRKLTATLNFTGAFTARAGGLVFNVSLQAALSFIGGANLYPNPGLYPESGLYPYGGQLLFQLNRLLPAVLRPIGTLTDNAAQSLLFTAVLQPQVIFLKTSARIILSAALMTTSFSAQKLSSTVAKALFASLRNAGALSSIHNPGSTEHGGGGWGVPMPDSYFQRYKPTLRRQRMKV